MTSSNKDVGGAPEKDATVICLGRASQIWR